MAAAQIDSYGIAGIVHLFLSIHVFKPIRYAYDMESMSRLYLYLSSFMLLLLLTMSPSISKADFAVYQIEVRQDETLSEILNELGLHPIWGKNGFLSKVIRLNPKVVSKNGNLVQPGTIINLLLPMHQTELDKKISKNYIKPLSRVPAQVKPQVSPAVEPEVAKGNDDGDMVQAELKFGNSRLEATDKIGGAKSTVLSELNSGVDLRLQFPMTEHLSFFGLLGAGVEQYSNFKDGITLGGSKQNVMSYGFGSDLHYSEKFSVRAQLEFSQGLFLKAVDTSLINIVKISVTKASLGGKMQLFENKKFKISGQLGSLYLLPTSAEDLQINSGAGYYGGLLMARHYRQRPVTMGFVYSFYSQSTNISLQKRSDLNFVTGTEF